jgi:integrase
MALLCVCFGLRISEALALKWSDIDWLNSKLQVERGIVGQIVDDVKTRESEGRLLIDGAVLVVLKTWKQMTQFSETEDWLFASPAQLGRLPWSYDQVCRVVPEGRRRGWNRQTRHSHDGSHVSFVARRGRDHPCRTTKTHAPCGHSKDDALRGCRHGRNGGRQ